MSVKNAQNAFNRLLVDAQKKFAGKFTAGMAKGVGSPRFFLTEVTFGGKSMMDGAIAGIADALDDAERIQGYDVEAFRRQNVPTVWKKLIADEMRKIRSTRTLGPKIKAIHPHSELQRHSGKTIPKFYYFGKPFIQQVGGVDACVILTFKKSGPDTAFREATKFLSDNLYKAWWDRMGEAPLFKGTEPEATGSGQTRTSREAGTFDPQTYKEKFDLRFKREHGEETTTALAALDSIRNQPFKYKGTVQVTSHDFLDAIFKDLEVDYQQNINKDGFRYGVDHLLQLRIGPNPQLPTDIKGIRETAQKTIRRLMVQRLEEGAEKQMSGNQFPVVPTALDFEASKSPRKQIEEDAVVTIAKAIKKNLKRKKSLKVTTKLKSKPLKKQKRKMPIKKKTSSKQAIKDTFIEEGMTVAGTKIANRRAKGKKSPDATLELMKLKGRINRQLPSIIKENMGRPALINRTGRFAESAEVVSMTQAPNSIRADYTYQRRPYETFENTGDKQWPTGYNPKPLIAKSIRQIAMVEVSDKFTLRRV